MRPKTRKLYMMEVRERTAANIEKQKRRHNMMNPINSQSSLIIRNKIQATTRAKEIISSIIGARIPETVECCLLEENYCLRGLDIHDLSIGIHKLGKEINKIIDSFKCIYDTIKGEDSSIYFHNCPLDVDKLLNICSVWAVTTKDVHSIVDVRNIFTGEIERQEVPNGESEDGMGSLGVYIPKTGSIMLFVDRIFKYENPELIFQTVMLHEFIHACLDIIPRIILCDKDGTKNAIEIGIFKDPDKYEETVDNTLLLYVYNWSELPTSTISAIQSFILNQPLPYKKALTEFDERNFDNYKQSGLKHLLKEKLKESIMDFNNNQTPIEDSPVKCYSVVNQEEDEHGHIPFMILAKEIAHCLSNNEQADINEKESIIRNCINKCLHDESKVDFIWSPQESKGIESQNEGPYKFPFTAKFRGDDDCPILLEYSPDFKACFTIDIKEKEGQKEVHVLFEIDVDNLVLVSLDSNEPKSAKLKCGTTRPSQESNSLSNILYFAGRICDSLTS